MTPRTRSVIRLLLPLALVLVLFATAYAQRDAQPPAAPATPSCPGQTAPAPIATGVYTQKPVPEIVINGAPAPGAIWKAGDRAYWHCHTGGQLLFLHEGVEHWHGAAPDASAHFFQTAIGNSTTLWMEEVGRDDYLGNDIGINSRNEFLKTGVRKKSNP